VTLTAPVVVIPICNEKPLPPGLPTRLAAVLRSRARLGMASLSIVPLIATLRAGLSNS
jgi:hypothetical protein